MGTFNEWSEGDGERHHSRVLCFFFFFLICFFFGERTSAGCADGVRATGLWQAQGVTGCWISQRCGFRGVNQVLDSPRVTRELRLTHSADANSRNERRIVQRARDLLCTCTPGGDAKRAVCALVDVAPLGPGGGDLPQTRRHTAPRTLKRKVPH